MAGRPRGRGRTGSRRTSGPSGSTPPDDPEAAGPAEDPEHVARQILLRRLTEQPRSRAELATTLDRRQVPADVAATLLDRFEEVGLVDDSAFAASWVESRHRGRGLARRALAHELRRKGVGDEVAREALGSIDEGAERDTARRLVERKLASVRGLDRQRAERRLVGMLARKGYGPDVALGVVRAALPARGNDADGHAGGDPPLDGDTPLDLH